MARMTGVTRGGSIIARIGFWLSRRRVGKVVPPLRLHALHTRLLMGYGQMEMAQEKARRVDASLKSLVQIRVAMQVGCPF